MRVSKPSLNTAKRKAHLMMKKEYLNTEREWNWYSKEYSQSDLY